MNWEEYKFKFYHYASFNGKDQDYINSCLNYAEKLFNKGLPVIYDQFHLSLLVGYDEKYLIKVSNSQELFYREFNILKKNKKDYRTISEPLPNLKNIQRWISKEILSNLEPSEYSKAFRTGYSIKDNAKFHRRQKKVLTIDLKDYFGSIDYKKVFTFFRDLGYSKPVSVMLAKICTLNDGLPQGSPTSPMLSNLITKNLDHRIAGFSRKQNIRYTRYADDLTFSGDFSEGYVIKFVKMILNSEGFTLNDSKTRVRKRNQRQEVTGIVVNEKMQASRKYRRDFRKRMYYIKKYGLNSHVEKIEAGNSLNYLYYLLGMANFIININPNDKATKEDYNYLKNLLLKS
ncbi:retron St85 family RNA-directed DNA polymerase [Bacillus halotolerans]|uniref:retron St85 family RNA-directed DNA polymerase n=1 Tax=Bacillus halotolerans TaxID=260554 RepID=UPI00192C1E91|nr:retron St85 family RNA-directed DNA polymerase [Bacillus halotolerans]MBL4963935.1 RNA-directed DNA polymerase [Bacillus halotolerans]